MNKNQIDAEIVFLSTMIEFVNKDIDVTTLQSRFRNIMSQLEIRTKSDFAEGVIEKFQENFEDKGTPVVPIDDIRFTIRNHVDGGNL